MGKVANGAAITKLAKSRGMTTADLAGAVGIPLSVMDEMVKKGKIRTPSDIQKIAQKLGVKEDALTKNA